MKLQQHHYKRSIVSGRPGTSEGFLKEVATNVILAIDPGPTQSAWVVYDTYERRVEGGAIEPNDAVLGMIWASTCDSFAIEMVESFGMAVGKEVFETVYWVGRFVQAWVEFTDRPFFRVYRKEVKLHLCRSMRAKDPNIRQALIDLLGPQGTKKAPGPTYGIKGDMWSALAVAVTAEKMAGIGGR